MNRERVALSRKKGTELSGLGTGQAVLRSASQMTAKPA